MNYLVNECLQKKITFFIDVIGKDCRRWTQRLKRKRSVAWRIPWRRPPTSLVSVQETKLIVDTVVSGRNRRILRSLLFLCCQISQNPVDRWYLKGYKMFYVFCTIKTSTYLDIFLLIRLRFNLNQISFFRRGYRFQLTLCSLSNLKLELSIE